MERVSGTCQPSDQKNPRTKPKSHFRVQTSRCKPIRRVQWAILCSASSTRSSYSLHLQHSHPPGAPLARHLHHESTFNIHDRRVLIVINHQGLHVAHDRTHKLVNDLMLGTLAQHGMSDWPMLLYKNSSKIIDTLSLPTTQSKRQPRCPACLAVKWSSHSSSLSATGPCTISSSTWRRNSFRRSALVATWRRHSRAPTTYHFSSWYTVAPIPPSLFVALSKSAALFWRFPLREPPFLPARLAHPVLAHHLRLPAIEPARHWHPTSTTRSSLSTWTTLTVSHFCPPMWTAQSRQSQPLATNAALHTTVSRSNEEAEKHQVSLRLGTATMTN